VQSGLVIPEQPVDGFIFALAKGFEVLAMQPFHLQRSDSVSLQALSQQLPLRLIEGVIPLSLSTLLNS
jgi:hypothetical protein